MAKSVSAKQVTTEVKYQPRHTVIQPALDQSTLSDFKAHANARKSLVANFKTPSQDTTNMNTFNESVTRKSIVTTTTSMGNEA